MTKEEYLEFHKLMCDRMSLITKAKNADYTGKSTDPFANFSKVEELGIASTEQGFLVRMTDKLMRINSFVQKGFLEVSDESVKDTLIDLANYCILFTGYLEDKKRSEKWEPKIEFETPTEKKTTEDVFRESHRGPCGIILYDDGRDGSTPKKT